MKIISKILIFVLVIGIGNVGSTITTYAKQDDDGFYYVNMKISGEDKAESVKVYWTKGSIYISGNDAETISGCNWDKQSVFDFYTNRGNAKTYKSDDVYVMEDTVWFNFEELSELLNFSAISDEKYIYIIQHNSVVDELNELFNERTKYSLESIRFVSTEVKASKALDIILNTESKIAWAHGSYDYNMYYDLLGELVKPESALVENLEGINKTMKVFKTYSEIYKFVERDADDSSRIYRLIVGNNSNSVDNVYESLKLVSKISPKAEDFAQAYAASSWSESIVNSGFIGIEKTYDSGNATGVLTNASMKKAMETMLSTYYGDGLDNKGLRYDISRNIGAGIIDKVLKHELKISLYMEEDYKASALMLDFTNLALGYVKDKIKKQLKQDINSVLQYKYYYDIQAQADNALRKYRMDKDYVSMKYSLYLYYRCAEKANASFVGRDGFDQNAVNSYIEQVQKKEEDLLNIPDVDLSNCLDNYSVDFENLFKTSDGQNVDDVVTEYEYEEEYQESGIDTSVCVICGGDDIPTASGSRDDNHFTGFVMDGGDYLLFDDTERVFSGTERERTLGMNIDVEYDYYNPVSDYKAYDYSDDCVFIVYEFSSNGDFWERAVFGASDLFETIRAIGDPGFCQVQIVDGLVYEVRLLYTP